MALLKYIRVSPMILSALIGFSCSNHSLPTTSLLNPQPQPSPGAAITTATVSIGGQTGMSIGPEFLGFSFNKDSIYSPIYNQNTTLVNLFKLLGPTGILRIGGTDVDCSIWYPSGAGQQKGAVAPADISHLANFVQSTGWRVIYGLNLLSATAQQSSEEAQNVATQLGNLLYGFEIGNEPNTYLKLTTGPSCGNKNNTSSAPSCSNPSPSPSPTASRSPTPSPSPSSGVPTPKPFTPVATFQDFYTQWAQVATAIVNEMPQAVLTGPAMGSTDSYYNSEWTTPFIQNSLQTGNPKVSLITAHYYPGFGESVNSTTCAVTFLTLSDLFSCELGTAGPGTTEYASNVSGFYDVVNPFGLPIRIDETNSFIGRPVQLPSGINDGMGSALWMIDHLFNTALNGATGINIIAGNGNEPGSYATFGFNGSYNSIKTVRAEYYGMLLFAMAGQGNLLQTSTSAGGLNVTSYTIQRANGELDVIINNKEPVQNLAFSMDAGRQVNSATLTLLTAPSLSSVAPEVSIQGAVVNTDGTMVNNPPYNLPYQGSTLTGYVNAGSAVLVKIQ